MTSNELRQKYLQFFEGKGHKVIPSAPLVPENDPTTLFNSAGMQPLIPYLLGQPHPQGKRLVNYQKCIRTGDIDEVGDSYHHTFFEMLGNWSLGDYFKEDSIPWSLEFLTKELEIPQDKIWVTVFAGDNSAPRDEESAKIWGDLGIPKERIFYLGVEDNWWAAGQIGPCGPDTEIFYDVTGKPCSDNCRPGDNCGRFVEIWNNVFMVYNRLADGSLEELPNKNVDTGMGLERTIVALNKLDDSYKSDLFWPVIERYSEITGISYEDHPPEIRVIVDHLKASVFLIKDGVLPANKLQGYVLRRLLRRAAIKTYILKKDSLEVLPKLVDPVIDVYKDSNYFQVGDWDPIRRIIINELDKFKISLDKGLKELAKHPEVTGKIAFDLYQTFGFPLEVTKELAEEKKGQKIDEEEFKKEFEKHQELSRTSSAGMFKGGLSGQGEIETRYHTATHLLHQALRTILGDHVSQKGSNITSERLRFDFSHPDKLTGEQIKKVEKLVNQKIKEDLPVKVETSPKGDALRGGALAFFPEKYPEIVTVYSIGGFSKEICMGPHVKSTGEIGEIKITKEESASAGIRRIYASVV